MTGSWEFARERVGSRVAGKFRLERVLGVGGMGAVYEAMNEATHRRLALKLVHPEVTRDPVGRERITREAKAANQIGHPGLVDIYDAGTDEDGTVYLCMELLEGQTLRAWLAGGDARLGDALAHLRAALEPLAAAHAAGFVHRDLKPENVFLTDARVKVLDLGLVRRTDASDASMDGTTIGTVHYMSPEQARGSSNASPASDVWSVGVMIHEMIAGRRPFEGESALDVMMTAAQEPAPPLEGVPDELRTLVEACLAKDPSARPPDAAALAPRLDAAMEALRREGGWDRPVDHAHFARGLTEVLPADSTPGASTEAAGATRPLDSSPARPVPPTAAMASAPGVADEADEPEMAIPSGGGILVKLIVGGVALLLLGGVGAMVWGMTSRTFDPTQVVLGVDGDGADFEARMREGFEAELDRFGFRVTVVEDPGDDPRAALLAKADELAAGHVVLLDLTNERARDGLTTETGYFRQGLAVRVLDGESGEEVQTHELVFGHDTLAEAEVAEEIVSAWVHSLGPLLIESLYERPALVQAMEGGAGVEISARAVDIAHNQSDIETIRAERTRLESACAARGEALAAANARSEPRVSCWGDPCGRSRLVGLTPDGSHAIVQDESPRPYYNFRAELRLAQVEERILRVPLDGGEPTVLATASDFHGVGGQSTGPQGHAVAVVEQGRGENLGLVGIDVASGERRVISVLGPRRAPSVVLPSPDGATVYVGGYGHGVMATAEGEDHPVSAWGLRGATWAELPELGVPHVLATYHRFHDEILLLQTDGHPAIEPTDLQGRFRGYAGAKDGLLHVLVSDAHGCYVSRFDPTTGEMVTVTHIDECVEDPQLLPDGRIVGVAEISGPDDTPGDVEIAIVAPGTGAVTALTRGSFREGRPRVAAAGDRIAFERRLDAPEGVRLDDGTVVCWLTP